MEHGARGCDELDTGVAVEDARGATTVRQGD